MAESELGNFRKVKIADFHRGHDHVKRFLAAGTHRDAHVIHVRKHMEQALIKTKISDAVEYLAVLNVEGSVPCHPRQDFFVGIDFADVPQSRD